MVRRYRQNCSRRADSSRVPVQKSEVIQGFHTFAAENSTKLDVVICKPWFIRPAEEGISLASLLPTSLKIPVDILAAALVDIVVKGSEEKNLRNDALRARGLEALANTS